MKVLSIHFKKALNLPGCSAHGKQSINWENNVNAHIEAIVGPEGVLIIDTNKNKSALHPFGSLESIVYNGTPEESTK